ncbi:hypothetical protein [Pedobacter foliorum]|uniref:hypothetical protein n=1 Tax=Pedobacter foliorum TaxID=2739058 RepID=UPI001565C875|nr:hypothetical protein [Pedobacter foliorum]NRF41104.1 hypothetical protein [Pedobacter foliorum]
MIIEAHQRIKRHVADLESLLGQKGYHGPFLATYQKDGKTLSDSLKYLMLTHEVLDKKLPKLSLVSQHAGIDGRYSINCYFSLDYNPQKGFLIKSMGIICLNHKGLTLDCDYQQINSQSDIPQCSWLTARVVPAHLKQKHRKSLNR